MPFNEKFLYDASREIEVKSIPDDFESVRRYIIRALEKSAEDTGGVFNPNDVDIYIHGSYANQTNIYFPSTLEIMVELKKTEEFTPETVEFRLFKNYYVDASLGFTPRDFRDLFFENLQELVGERAQLDDKAIAFESIGKVKHPVEITPCFSFAYQNEEGEKFRGVLLYDQSVGAHIITFPRLHAANGRTKDVATKGNFKRMVRLLKSLNTIYSREFGVEEPGTATGYFIECLLYNVPNKLFLDNNYGGDFNDIFLKVLNYLVHCELGEFICQNHVWQLFGLANEFWTTERAGDYLGAVVHLYHSFPPMREFMA